MKKLLLNILVVDSDSKNRDTLNSILEATKLYRVVCVDTDTQALKELENEEFSLILIDVNLLTKEIINKEIPTILLFENVKIEKIKAKFVYKILDYIEKPFEELELLHRVKIHIKPYSVECKALALEILSLSNKSLNKACQDYTQLIESDEINIYNIYNDYKNIEFIMSKPEQIEPFLCQSLNKSLNSYYKDDNIKKESMQKGINKLIVKFMKKLSILKPIIITKDEWYKDSSKYLKQLANTQGCYLQIDDKKSLDFINILNYGLIVDFFNSYKNEIRPIDIIALLTKEQEILLKIAPSLVLFSDIDEVALLEIVKTINFSKYHSGETIYDHRERIYTLDYILSGSVDFYTYKKKFIGTLKTKQLFGELLFDSSRIFRYADIIAKGDVILLSMTIDMKKRNLYPEVFFKLYENIIKSIGEKVDIIADTGVKP